MKGKSNYDRILAEITEHPNITGREIAARTGIRNGEVMMALNYARMMGHVKRKWSMVGFVYTR